MTKLKYWLGFDLKTGCWVGKSNFNESHQSGIEWEELYEDQIRKENKESTMKIKVKENVIVFDEKNKKQVELKAGTYDYSNNLVCGVCLTKEFVENSSLFEVIEDWKPNPYHEDSRIRYTSSNDIYYVMGQSDYTVLTQKERALRKLKQIADHLNGGWKPDWRNEEEKKWYVYSVYSRQLWTYSWDSTSDSGERVYFKEMNDKILNQILSWMNNGDGVCMNDLLED